MLVPRAQDGIYLKGAGARREDITLLNGLGTHRPNPNGTRIAVLPQGPLTIPYLAGK